MKKMIAVLASCVMGVATAASAQSALELAQAQNVCGSAAPLGAEFLEDGRLQVSCPQGSVSGAEGLPPTGLAENPALAALGGIIVVAAVAGGGGGDGAPTTTTTTTTGGS